MKTNRIFAMLLGCVLHAAAADVAPPAVEFVLPPTNTTIRALEIIEVHFTEPVLGVEAPDLRINNVPATNVTEVAPGAFVFEFAPPGTGVVNVAWAVGHGIKDGASPPNDFAGGAWTYRIDPNVVRASVRLNEFVADNTTGLRDEDGATPDWLELYNAGASPVNLDGWFLTDDPLRLDKWRFPSFSMLANGYLVVFASEKNRTNATPPARLHTNFKLEKNGEYLALVSPFGEVISEFAPAFPPQESNVSYGRDRLDPDLVGFFPTPTPGAANSSSGAGFAPDVTYSRDGGAFTTSFTLALWSPVSNTVIRYVLITNAAQASAAITNVPTTSSTLYTGPIPISVTTQVRARAFAPGLFPGPPSSASYIQVAPSLASGFSSDLPLLILHNFGAGSVPATSDQTATLTAFDGGTNRTRLTDTPTLSTRTGINIRGSSSQGYAKSSFAVELWDQFNQDDRKKFLGLSAESDWVLYAPNDFEPVLIHNPFFYKFSREIGRYAPQTRFVEVFVKTGSGAVSSTDYNGVYVLEEKIKQSKGRVDVNDLDPEDNVPPAVSGGYIFKTDRRDADEFAFTGAGQSVILVYPNNMTLAQPQYAAQLSWIQNYFGAFSSALNGANWTHPVTGYAQYVDVNSWVDHMIINVSCFNVDAVRLSGYYFKDRARPLEMGPVWDCDRGLGSTDGRDANPRVWSARRGTDYFREAGWYGRLFADTNFFQRYVDRYQEFRAGPISTSNLLALIDGYVAELAEAQPREQAKWGGKAPPRKADGSSGGTYATEVSWLKNWLTNRLHFMDTNFLARPVFSRAGGAITSGIPLSLTGPTTPAGTTIYYTLDGSDPRGFNGIIAPGARTYSGPIPLSNNARVVARARNLNHRNLTGSGNPQMSVPWSGPVTESYHTHLPLLTVTELMYHPAPAPPPAADNADDFEFIELKNCGTSLLDLVGMHFTNGIEFTFAPTSAVTQLAPGGYVVLVKDRAVFATRHPGLTNIAGEFSGNLDNQGERLRLEGPLGEPIVDFSFKDGWQPSADGNGRSLVPVVESAPASGSWTNAASWRASAQIHGSPGAADPPPDTDGDGLPDDWELANGTDPLVPDANADPDGDGFTNFQEFLAGTSPTNALSALRVSITLSNGVQLAFFASSNKAYSLLRRANLMAGPWQRLLDISPASTNRWVTLRDTNAPQIQAQGFYRLVTPQPP